MNRHKAVAAALGALLLVALIALSVVAYYNHERDLDERCLAAHGRRVDIGVQEKLCFTEDWKWVQL